MKFSTKFHNLLLNKNVCSICLHEKCELIRWDTTHAIQMESFAVEVNLKDMICSTFGSNVYALLLSKYFCDTCADKIIQSYIMLLDIKLNFRSIQFYTAKLSEQFDKEQDSQTVAIKLDSVGTINQLGIEINNEVFYEKSDNEYYTSSEEYSVGKLKNEASDHYDNESYGEQSGNNEVFECPICFLNFDLLTSYEGHYKTCYRNVNIEDSKKPVMEDNEIEYTCGICSESFSEMSILLKHREKHKQTHRRRKKSINSSDGKSNSQMRQKLKIPTKVVCDICGKNIYSPYINRHRLVHKHQKQCTVCLKFISVSAFGNHMLSVHALDDEIYKPNCLKSCPYCSYETKQPHLLDGHINKNHLGVRPYLCDVCSKPFHCKHQLGGHIKTHSRDKAEQCELCGDRFKYKRSLMMHLRLHTGEKPVKCSYCDKYFSNTSRRREHEVDNHLCKDFVCEYCNKECKSSNALRLHKRGCIKKDQQEN